MPLQIETCEGTLVVSEQQIRAVARHAERQADLTAAVLDATGCFPKRPAVLPAGFLLELAAVLELGLWERQGVRQYLNTDLPTFHEAATELAARVAKGVPEFQGPEVTPLSARVLRVWMENFAWDGPDIFSAEIVLDEVEEDQFADMLAEFVWQHRHELSKFFADPSATHSQGIV
jgi:hypothetical protein